MSQGTDQPAYSPLPPPRKSSNTWIYFLAGLLLVVVGFPVICCGGCLLQSHWQFQQRAAKPDVVREKLKATPVVKEHIGDDVVLDVDYGASIHEQKVQGRDDVLVFTAQGSIGKGILVVTLTEDSRDLIGAVLQLPDGREFRFQ